MPGVHCGFADAVEQQEPGFAAWMRQHGKLAVLQVCRVWVAMCGLMGRGGGCGAILTCCHRAAGAWVCGMDATTRQAGGAAGVSVEREGNGLCLGGAGWGLGVGDEVTSGGVSGERKWQVLAWPKCGHAAP
jgi:hypothetical protein